MPSYGNDGKGKIVTGFVMVWVEKGWSELLLKFLVI